MNGARGSVKKNKPIIINETYLTFCIEFSSESSLDRNKILFYCTLIFT